MRILFALIACASLLSAGDHGQGHGKGHGKHGKEGKFVPPGLAKKGGMPPGLAKKFGPRLPPKPYMAVDPRHKDRVYVLMDGRWELQKGLSVSLQAELGDVLRMPAAPPPVPLPHVGVDLHVVLFE